MKIRFSKKEYRLLVDMLNLANWMMHSHDIDEDEQHNQHKALRKKVLSFYKEMQAEDIIEYSRELDDYFELAEYDHSLHENFIDKYDNDTFWDGLISRLAQRDLIAQIGDEEFYNMDVAERVVALGRIEQKYTDEFEENVLENITVKGVKGK